MSRYSTLLDVVAAPTDFLVGDSDEHLLADKQKNLVWENRKEWACTFRRFLWTRFLMSMSDSTSDVETGACSHGMTE